MKKFKQMLRCLLFIILMILAVVGLGISPAVIPSVQRKKDRSQTKVEQVESPKTEEENETDFNLT